MALKTTIFEGTPPRYYRWQKRWGELITIVRAMHWLVESKLPLAEGLLNLSQDDAPRSLSYAFYWLHDDVSKGVPLSRAMGNQPNIFPEFCVDVVRAGENSGKLEEALGNLLSSLENSFHIRRRASGHGVYLVYLLIAECILMAFLNAFVLPQFSVILNALGRDINIFARIFLEFDGMWLLALAAGAVPFVWVAAQYSALSNGTVYRTLLSVEGLLPGLRRGHMKRHLANACDTCALLTAAGIPLHSALQSAADTNPSNRCRKILVGLADGLEAGDSLGDLLGRSEKGMPTAMRSILRLSEASGQVPDGFRQVSDLYRAQGRRGALMLIEIGAPVVLCCVGLLVFAFYSAVFLAIIDLGVSGIEIVAQGP